MTKPRTMTVRIDADLAEAMDALHTRQGTPLSEQIRRALRPWLEAQGVLRSRKSSAEKKTGKKP
jgi:hypothetical protein